VFENPNPQVAHDPAINRPINGTILTTTGDYRFLSGNYQFGRLRLSAFDGAHAFLFDAKVQADGSLKGDFWSRDVYHRTWTATRKDDATLPDTFGMVGINEQVTLDELSFSDLEGRMRNLGEEDLRGKVTVLEVFGTWCPNCHDSSELLSEIQEKYGLRGLRVVGLAFEITGDTKRSAKMVRRFAEYHDAKYPMLLGGSSKEREKAVEAVKMIDQIKAWPTTIFVGPDGKAKEVDTGFSGPATGDAYHALRARYESIIERLLSEAD
jgi:thiol-disulfide isomerase/thioredoxin